MTDTPETPTDAAAEAPAIPYRFDPDATAAKILADYDGLEDGTESVSYTHLTLPTTPYV